MPGNLAERAKRAVRRFIEESAPYIHPALGVPAHFNEETSEFEPWQVHDLRASIERQVKENELMDFEFDWKRCTWADVTIELERAQAAATKSESGSGMRKAWNTACRGLAISSEVCGPGIEAIPDHLCVLKGGLALIFSIARHREQNRSMILDAFKDIPSIVEMARNKARCFPVDEHHPGNAQLHEKIWELQTTLLRTLPDLIDTLSPKGIGGWMSAPFKGHHIGQLLQDVKRSTNDVYRAAESITDAMLTETTQTTKDIRTVTKGTGEKVQVLCKKMDELLQRQSSLQATIEAISGKTAVYQFLVEHLKLKPQTAADEQLTDSDELSPASSWESPAVSMTPSQLLQLLDVHHLAALEDADRVVRRHHSLHNGDIGKAALMVRAPAVQHLLQAPQAGVVLVEGHFDRTLLQSSQISPLSYVCANLALALRAGPPGATLVFFCGMHTDQRLDSLCGPQGMMRSLLTQLTLTMLQDNWIAKGEPISTLPHGQVVEDITSLSLPEVCELFHRLLRAVPPHMSVFCLVDSISCYEVEQWHDDYDFVMDAFGRIIADPSLGAHLKLLMTCPTKSRRLLYLQPHQRVSLRNQSASSSGDDLVTPPALESQLGRLNGWGSHQEHAR